MRVPAILGRFWSRLFPPLTLGQRGERAAARYLKRQGYYIVSRGERPGLGRGELDLVAVDGRTVIFVEVKTRASDDAGHPTEAVDQEKQRRITLWALAFLRRHGLLEQPARFDVVAVTWPAGKKRPKIEHFLNAFEAAGQLQMFR